MADWETEVGLRRAWWLWRESTVWHRRRKAKRRLERQERKLSASLFIKKEVGLRIIWIGFGWMEFLQKLQGEQLAALSRRWIIWSGVTDLSSSALKQFAASTLLKNEDGLLDLTIRPGWAGFLRRLQACQLEVFTIIWDIWSGVTARYIRVRRQAEEVPHHQRLWEGGFCCGIANCHHERCDPTGLVITTVFALGVIRLVW